ncbi:hypothetical protein GGS21DRAFT_237792 [Xylaria nigripes]|nr:hypothetical protein GGS21DRAFT_237792 [Xylaria nigripes]
MNKRMSSQYLETWYSVSILSFVEVCCKLKPEYGYPMPKDEPSCIPIDGIIGSPAKSIYANTSVRMYVYIYIYICTYDETQRSRKKAAERNVSWHRAFYSRWGKIWLCRCSVLVGYESGKRGGRGRDEDEEDKDRSEVRKRGEWIERGVLRRKYYVWECFNGKRGRRERCEKKSKKTTTTTTANGKKRRRKRNSENELGSQSLTLTPHKTNKNKRTEDERKEKKRKKKRKSRPSSQRRRGER